MKSLERRFKKIQEKKPHSSSYVWFAEAVTGEGFSKKAIYFWFPKLVDNEEYEKNIKKDLLDHLCRISNMPVAGIKRMVF